MVSTRLAFDGLDQGGQVAHVLAHLGVALVAELHAQEIRARLGIDEHDCLAARDGILRECGADQPGAGDHGCHERSLDIMTHDRE